MEPGDLIIYTLPGLEEYLKYECIKSELNVKSVNPLGIGGRVLISRGYDPAKILSLRTAENGLEVIGLEYLALIDARNIRLAIRRILRGMKKGECQYSIKTGMYGRCFSHIHLTRIFAREFERVFKKKPLESAANVLKLELYCRDKIVVVGRLLSNKPLHKRPYFKMLHPASLNPLIASAIAIEAKRRGLKLLYDPMCGCGTIPIEYLLTCRGEAYASDIVMKHVKATGINALSAGVDDRCHPFCSDISLPALASQVDILAANPPRGRRMRADVKAVYRKLHKLALKMISKDGLFCIVTPYKFTVARVFSRFSLEKEVRVLKGNLKLYLMILTPSR
ncbi:MAG: hypothetical protein B6U94_07955 [Thermofilum sp. ex4484_79]|nr:MAG: hypothetical protein B6U94_07955 [Thermofilum sp. ex4484_79]